MGGRHDITLRCKFLLIVFHFLLGFERKQGYLKGVRYWMGGWPGGWLSNWGFQQITEVSFIILKVRTLWRARFWGCFIKVKVTVTKIEISIDWFKYRSLYWHQTRCIVRTCGKLALDCVGSVSAKIKVTNKNLHSSELNYLA